MYIEYTSMYNAECIIYIHTLVKYAQKGHQRTAAHKCYVVGESPTLPTDDYVYVCAILMDASEMIHRSEDHVDLCVRVVVNMHIYTEARSVYMYYVQCIWIYIHIHIHGVYICRDIE